MNIINTAVSYIKTHWRAIGVAIFVFFAGGAAASYLQTYIMSRQLAHEQRAPDLHYHREQWFTPAEKAGIYSQSTRETLEALNNLTEEYYSLMTQRMAEQPDADYLEVMQSVLPLTTTMAAAPTPAAIEIENGGTATATQVRVSLEADQPITDIRTKEPYKFVKGKMGDTSIVIEIDRLVATGKATIDVICQRPEPLQAILSLELSSSTYAIYNTATESYEKVRTIEQSDVPVPLLLRISYTPEQAAPFVSIFVDSNEGPATTDIQDRLRC